ncbi:MAG: type II and III secretion system protein, partial [Lentisphaerae bacterium]|nr:type II and III secretion system protein [Lentisphaerota bacterium]
NWIANTVITPTRTFTDTIDKGDLASSTLSDKTTDLLTKTKVASAVMSVSDVSLFVSALQKMDNVDMISHPLIIVGNKVESKIHVGERYPTVTSTRSDNVDATTVSAYSEEVEWNDLGLTLWVVPEIDTENDMVRISVNPKMSTWVKDIETKSGSVLPVISTRHLSSRVQIPSGYTVAIGGLIDSQKRVIEKKIPLLGDIPILGRLFRHNEDTVEKHNLIILLTVTILDDHELLTGMEQFAEPTMLKLEDPVLEPNKATPVKQQVYPWKPDTEKSSGTKAPPESEPAVPAPDSEEEETDDEISDEAPADKGVARIKYGAPKK